MNETSTFIYVLKLLRPRSMDNMSPEEEEIINEHFEHLKRKLNEGTLILAGPCLDGAFGIVIFRSLSQEEAETFMNNDPAVIKGLMTAELHPFHISLIELLNE
ncbi:MAG: hypothetical protein HXS48_24565 [Theionarchaea archaeon]|nr:MAG: hypothetical protein AYK19_21690 [Theionarchaea archaeon DG-70-1]MBU7030129.1 hypothetical protein [Theionarchaea archaeon]